VGSLIFCAPSSPTNPAVYREEVFFFFVRVFLFFFVFFLVFFFLLLGSKRASVSSFLRSSSILMLDLTPSFVYFCELSSILSLPLPTQCYSSGIVLGN